MVDHENILTRKFFTRNFLTRKFPELQYTITQNLDNDWHIRTTTPAIDTRPIFLAQLSVCLSIYFVIFVIGK